MTLIRGVHSGFGLVFCPNQTNPKNRISLKIKIEPNRTEKPKTEKPKNRTKRAELNQKTEIFNKNRKNMEYILIYIYI